MYIIPNILTVIRLILVPIIVLCMLEHQMALAFVLFVIAGVTDGIDGYLARKFGWSTELGAWLDPAADKALLVSIYITLGLFSTLPIWLVIMVVSRDILILGAIIISWLMDRPVRVSPLMISKINTTAQILLAAAVLADLGFWLGVGRIVDILIIIVAATTILSAIAYLKGWFKHMVRYE